MIQILLLARLKSRYVLPYDKKLMADAAEMIDSLKEREKRMRIERDTAIELLNEYTA